MSALLKKELRLGALLLTYLFIGFGLMAMIPGYPILCGVFFITLGIFQSFLNAREANDLVYSALLPVAKADVVRGKFLFAAFIELALLPRDGAYDLRALQPDLRGRIFQDRL